MGRAACCLALLCEVDKTNPRLVYAAREPRPRRARPLRAPPAPLQAQARRPRADAAVAPPSARQALLRRLRRDRDLGGAVARRARRQAHRRLRLHLHQGQRPARRGMHMLSADRPFTRPRSRASVLIFWPPLAPTLPLPLIPLRSPLSLPLLRRPALRSGRCCCASTRRTTRCSRCRPRRRRARARDHWPGGRLGWAVGRASATRARPPTPGAAQARLGPLALLSGGGYLPGHGARGPASGLAPPSASLSAPLLHAASAA
jgi:hypothetical protein